MEGPLVEAADSRYRWLRSGQLTKALVGPLENVGARHYSRCFGNVHCCDHFFRCVPTCSACSTTGLECVLQPMDGWRSLLLDGDLFYSKL